MTLKRYAVGAVAALLIVTCANAQTPAYTVQIVPDPPSEGRDVVQRIVRHVLPDGRYAVTNVYSDGSNTDHRSK